MASLTPSRVQVTWDALEARLFYEGDREQLHGRNDGSESEEALDKDLHAAIALSE